MVTSSLSVACLVLSVISRRVVMEGAIVRTDTTLIFRHNMISCQVEYKLLLKDTFKTFRKHKKATDKPKIRKDIFIMDRSLQDSIVQES